MTETKWTYSSKGKKKSAVNQDEIDNLNGPKTIKEIKFAIKNFWKRNFHAISNVIAFEVSFIGEFSQTFKELTPILHNLLQRKENTFQFILWG